MRKIVCQLFAETDEPLPDFRQDRALSFKKDDRMLFFALLHRRLNSL